MRFDFAFAADAVFGAGRSVDLSQLLLDRGWSRPGVVIDAAVAKTSGAQAVVARLSRSLGSVVKILEVDTAVEPEYDYLDQCAEEFRGLDPDSLVGIGGGSAMDLCKGVAILMTNPGHGIEYRGFDRVKEPAIPTVLLPTTAGTGSEATATAVFIDRETNTKLGINGRHVSPRLAVLDPDLTATCPCTVAVGSGLDAMVHSLEAFMTCGDHPIAHAFAEAALLRLFTAFPAAVNDPDASDARLEMLLAAYFAGITLRYSAGGVAGALSYPLGAEFGVPHGLAGGLLIPAIVRQNIEGGYDGFARMEGRLAFASGSGSEVSERFIDRVKALFSDIGAPRDLSNYRVRREHVPHLVQQTIAQRSGVLRANPVPADEQYLTAVLESVLIQ